jgi:hypothetical protein
VPLVIVGIGLFFVLAAAYYFLIGVMLIIYYTVVVILALCRGMRYLWIKIVHGP